MREELQAYLDGELKLEDLPQELQADAQAWDGLLSGAVSMGPAGAPLGFDERVMAQIHEERAGVTRRIAPKGSPVLGVIRWLTNPRPINVSPLAAAAVVAGLLLVAVGPRLGFLSTPEAVLVETPSTVFVQFVVEAPRAESVELVGDFNSWEPTIALEDLDGDGVWTGRVPLEAGVHEYMFVLDGTNWVSDPNAESYADDGFGQMNSIVAIPEPVSGT
ncbi:MAG: hypothetical protein V3U67_03710 [Gemmatimonadota bacterium]